MAAKLVSVLMVSAVASAIAIPLAPVAVAHGKLAYAEAEAPAHYEFQYSVADTHTGDVKQQHESRQGDAVQGSYSLLQPDGVTRVVDYTADKEHGFNAQVRYEGHPQAPAKLVAKPAYAPAPVYHAAPVAKVAYAVPVAKIAYAPAPVYHAAPLTKIAYAAPVAKVAYAAPVAKIAYAAPAAKVYTENHSYVTFSSPAISYHH